ncbi:coiled-coil domain-containing protein 112 isoform X2 [Serinus canaria]|uniref:coiled-coil domain-containing protein 112 isoform X2 n=1 Tax=Serinus canaria TaxID=9135 RepID=UPI0008DB5D34|nr:coiled-coil domain-containing protein 112 isoform X2 [Serinus canaria]
MAALAPALAAAAGRLQNESCSSTAGAGRQAQSGKIKAERAKKVEFLRTAEKLKAQLANIEKDNLYNRKSDFRVGYRLLEELDHSMTVSRKMEKAKILQQLSKIQNNVKRLQQQLKDVKPTPEFVDKIKEMMEEIENAINAFKEEQRQMYQQLLKEEKAVINELSLFERKVELWALGSSTAEKVWKLPSARVTVDKTLENHLPKEVIEFEKFLQRTGGRQGGWDDYDHQNFLKIRTKYKGRLSYVDEALEYLSGRTKEDIEQHDKWYQEYIILHERKKESIKKWKEKQQKEKESNLKDKEKSEKMLKERWLQREEAQKQKAEEERKRKQAAVEVWKKQKVVAFAVDQASQLKLEEKEKKQQKEHLSHVKLLLERNTLEKKVKEELEKLENEKKEKAETEGRKKIAAEEISKFQEHVEVRVTRDRSRWNRPSKGEERSQEMASAAAEPLLRVSQRAVPAWRGGS